jgi:type II secretory pathway predicted ATPase ExeA
MNTKLVSLYGLKWNPFSPELPTEALLVTSRLESFCWKIENALVREGGFALVTGDPGTGKSVALRLLSERLGRVQDLKVAALTHTQCNVADFYRELGELFGISLKGHNRWGGFKALRERWQQHIDTTLMRPVLLVDEAQELSAAVLTEMRLLMSVRFDSKIILSVVLAGDGRLSERLRRDELLPLGSRIRTRLCTEYATAEDLLACLHHLLSTAGNPALMTAELQSTLAEHSAGNHRVMTTMAGELLAAAMQRDLPHLDEKLYFDVFSAPRAAKAPVPAKGARRP